MLLFLDYLLWAQAIPTILNFASSPVSWAQYPSLADTIYTAEGNYDSEGKIKIVDQGPSNLESLLKSFMN